MTQKESYQQYQVTFFDEDSPPPASVRQWRGDFDNPNCAFHKWTGDMKKIQPLVVAATSALDTFNHHCVQSSAIFGTPTQCEQVVHIIAEVLDIPLVRILSLFVETTNDILVRMSEVCEEATIQTFEGDFSLELVLLEPPTDMHHLRGRYFKLPPLILYITELRDLPNAVLRRVLKATSPGEGHMLNTGDWFADCENICWILASEDRQLLQKLGPRFPLVDLRE
jgi:hypothetical protein